MPSTEREDCDICDKTGTRPDFGLGGSVSPHASSDLATFKIPMPFASCFRTLAFGRAVYLRPTELHALGDGALSRKPTDETRVQKRRVRTPPFFADNRRPTSRFAASANWNVD